MKLYQVTYIDDCEDCSYLTVGTSKEEVEKRETEKLSTLACFMGCWVEEINEVNSVKLQIRIW